MALVGLIATVTVESHGGKYAALCVLLLGSYVAAPLTVAWLSGNTPGKQQGRFPSIAKGAYMENVANLTD